MACGAVTPMDVHTLCVIRDDGGIPRVARFYTRDSRFVFFDARARARAFDLFIETA